MPTSIKSIFLSTKSVPATVYPAIPCFINTFLDFSQPPALNFTTLPTLATPNKSQFDVQADNETWFLAAKSDLVEFFRDKKTSVNWIHQGGTYDALLFIFGLPFALWVSSLAGRLTAIDTLPSVIKTATYIYIFVFALNAFRLFFSYTRWVFPKVELETEHSSPFKHRGIWVPFSYSTPRCGYLGCVEVVCWLGLIICAPLLARGRAPCASVGSPSRFRPCERHSLTRTAEQVFWPFPRIYGTK